MREFARKYGHAIATGVILAVSFPAWRLYPLAWVALAPLFNCTRHMGPRIAFGRFFLAGWVFHTLLLQWLVTNIYWAGGWAVLGQQVLCAILALYWGAAGGAWALTNQRCPWLPKAFTAAILWMSMEFLQARLFSGFGWSSLAYSQGPNAFLRQWAAVGGAPFISALIVAANASLALAFTPGKSRLLNAASAAVLILGAHAGGAALLSRADYDSKPLRVGLLQANFPLEMKWDWEYCEEMVRNSAAKCRLLAENEQVDLFVWPETLIMDELQTSAIIEEVSSLSKDTGCALFAGSQRQEATTTGWRNSSYMIDANGEVVGYYDKIHLAPFGEYVPFGEYIPFVQRIIPAISDIEPGSKVTTFPVDGRCMGPLICFEVVFAEMAERLRREGADFLVVITNLGWFGASNAIPQEMEIARLRAVETRLPVVHCANTGISGVFDPWGRFEMINAGMTRSGRYARMTEDVTPAQTIGGRFFGALPVAAPGTRPVPWPPYAVPTAALITSAALLVYCVGRDRLTGRFRASKAA